MDRSEAARLLALVVPEGAGAWADFGAGEGTFTEVLASRLGEGGRVFAIDRDAAALDALRSHAGRGGAEVITVTADLRRDFDLPDATPAGLDGLLVANTLHFMDEPVAVLSRLVAWLRPGGVAVIIEYDQRPKSRWVPHPIDSTDLPRLFTAAGLGEPRVVARSASEYGGEMYVAVGRRPAVAQA